MKTVHCSPEQKAGLLSSTAVFDSLPEDAEDMGRYPLMDRGGDGGVLCRKKQMCFVLVPYTSCNASCCVCVHIDMVGCTGWCWRWQLLPSSCMGPSWGPPGSWWSILMNAGNWGKFQGLALQKKPLVANHEICVWSRLKQNESFPASELIAVLGLKSDAV